MKTLSLNLPENATKIDVSTLKNLLENITKSTICSIIYLVDDSRSKTIKGEKQLQKLVKITSVYLNHDYTKKVKNLTGNEDFKAMELKGKTRISSTLLQSDKTNQFLIDGKVLYSEAVTILSYFHKGEPISEIDAVAKDLFTDAYYNPKEKTTMGRGTVSIEDDFYIINTALTKIKYIKLEGEQYEIV